MRTVSTDRARENRERRQAMVIVRTRDKNACVGGLFWGSLLPEDCYGPLNGHEVITRGQGGSIVDPANIVLLCDRHNEWCQSNHDKAVELGFRVSRTDPEAPKIPARLPHLDPETYPF